jgi:hypothetical protein
MFVAANYDWDDPLSAKSYQAWRERLPEKRDEVIEAKDFFRIRTDTGSGDLREATLTLKAQDLRPVEGRFEFRNREWVEIREVADEAEPGRPIARLEDPGVGTHAKLPSEGTAPEASVPVPVASATVADELHVLAALHQAGADLGDPIEVSRTGGKILVSGVGIPTQRQQQIHDLLGSDAQVVIRFSDAAPAVIQPQKRSSDTPAGSDIRQLQARMAEQVGGRMNFEQLASQILDLSEPMMARAYALRRLAERFPAGSDSQFSAEDRQVLRRLQQEHTVALRQQAAEMDRLLKPALSVFTGQSAPEGSSLSSTWQPATEELFQSARRVDKLLAAMFGAAPGESAGEQLPAQLLSSLAQLRARIEAYDRLSAKAMERREE